MDKNLNCIRLSSLTGEKQRHKKESRNPKTTDVSVSIGDYPDNSYESRETRGHQEKQRKETHATFK